MEDILKLLNHKKAQDPTTIQIHICKISPYLKLKTFPAQWENANTYNIIKKPSTAKSSPKQFIKLTIKGKRENSINMDSRRNRR